MTGPLSRVLLSSLGTSAGRKGIVARKNLGQLLGPWMEALLPGPFLHLDRLEIPSSALPKPSEGRAGGFIVRAGIVLFCLSYEFSNFTASHGGRFFFVRFLYDKHI